MTKRNEFYAVLASVLTAVFSLSLFPIFRSQLQDTLSLPIGIIAVFLSYLFLGGLFGLVLSATTVLCGRRCVKWAIVAAISIAAIAWIKSSFMQWDYGPMDGTSIDWSRHRFAGILDVGLIVAVTTIAFWQRRAVIRHIMAACAFLCLAQALFAVWISPVFTRASFADLLVKETILTHPKTSEILSTSENLILIVLDTFPSDVFGEIIRRQEEFKTELSGFTFYSDAISTYPYTWLSIPSVLTGQFYLNQTPYPHYLYEAYQNPLSILSRLKKAGYFVELDKWGSASPIPHLSDLSSNSERLYLPRLETLGTIQLLALYYAAPQFIKQLWHENTFETFMSLAGLRDNNLSFVRNVMSLPIQKTERPVAKFVHLKGPHLPLYRYAGYGFDYFSAAARPENAVAEKATASRENLTIVAGQSIKSVSAYLDKLRHADVYDRSTIVVFGDHGAGLQGQDFLPLATSPTSAAEKVALPVQKAAFPLLLVKPVGASGPLKTSAEAVSLSDLNCSLHGLLEEKTADGCRSLFQPTKLADRNERLYYSVTPNIDKDWYYPVMRQFKIGSPAWSNDSWRDTGRLFSREKAVRASPYEFGTAIKFGKDGNSRNYQALGWNDPGEGFTWTIGRQSTLTIPVKVTPAGPIILEAAFVPFVYGEKLAAQRIQVYANGERITEWFALGGGRYSAVIPRRLALEASIEIRFRLADATSPLSLGINEDALLYGVQMQSLILREVVYRVGDLVRFGRDGTSAPYQIEGWNDPSEGFTWTVGKTSRIALPATTVAGKPLQLEASLVPFVLPERLPTQRVEVSVNGTRVAEWSVDKPGQFTAHIPGEIVSDGIADIRFDLPDATSPAAMGLNNDTMVFAVQVVTLTLRDVP